jgi:hypothetical protein
MAGASFVDARRALYSASDAAWTEDDGAIALFDGPESPVTQVFCLGLFQPVSDEQLDRIEAFFRERQAPIAHDVCPLAGVPTASLLASRTYRPVEFSSVLYLPLTGVPDTSRSQVPVRRIGASQAELWAQTAAAGWGDIIPVSAEMTALMQVVASRERSNCFLAEIDGRPVAAGSMHIHEGVALLAGAATIPAARRRGAQSALLYARLALAAELGCDIAMMCAEPGSASQRNAERNGFRIAYTRTKWRLDA